MVYSKSDKNPCQCPPVISSKPFEVEDRILSKPGSYFSGNGESDGNELTVEDGWLVIGDTRLKVNCSPE